MNHDKYFKNIRKLEEIISNLNEGNLDPDEAKNQYEIGKKLMEECESILSRYPGTIEETDFI